MYLLTKGGLIKLRKMFWRSKNSLRVTMENKFPSLRTFKSGKANKLRWWSKVKCLNLPKMKLGIVTAGFWTRRVQHCDFKFETTATRESLAWAAVLGLLTKSRRNSTSSCLMTPTRAILKPISSMTRARSLRTQECLRAINSSKRNRTIKSCKICRLTNLTRRLEASSQGVSNSKQKKSRSLKCRS